MKLTSNKQCNNCKIAADCKNVCLDGVGNIKSEIAVIVEAPTTYDAETGILLSGTEYDIIEDAFKKADLSMDNVYTTSLISCATPDNRKPSASEIRKCTPYLNNRLSIVKPKFVLLMGHSVAKELLGHKFTKFPTITKLRGKTIEDDGTYYITTVRTTELGNQDKVKLLNADVLNLSILHSHNGPPQENELDYLIVEDHQDADYLLKKLEDCTEVAIDIETTGLDPFEKGADIVSIGFGFHDEQICLPVGFDGYKDTELVNELINKIGKMELNTIAHNGKFDLLWLRVIWGWKWELSFDTMLAHYLIDENDGHSLKHLSKIYFGAYDYDISLEDKTGQGDLKNHCEYLAKDVLYTYKLKNLLLKQMDDQLLDVFNELLMPTSNLFTEVEYNGVYIDTDKMLDSENFLRGEIDRYEDELRQYDPHCKINWNSSQQIAKLLFEDLGLEVVEYTEKGAISTSASVLKRIDHPVARSILGYREVNKQLTAFIDGWKPYIRNSRIHPTFRLTGTVTGRPSCSNPNLQQVPRDPRIRSLITAPPGKVLIEFDLSQAELRLAADASQDENMIKAFNEGVDIHWKTGMEVTRAGRSNEDEMLATATEIAGNPVTDYDEAYDIIYEAGPDTASNINPIFKDIRKKAKAVNFGFLYGMWHTKFKYYAKDEYGIDVSDEEAKEIRELFFKTYPRLEKWHRTQKRVANNYGEVTSKIGRKRRLPNALHHDDSPLCRSAERQAINTPIQSFASDWNLMVALQVRKEFPPPRVRIIGTVHDSVLCEVSENILPRFCKRILEIIQKPALLETFRTEISVPMLGDIEIGAWGSGKPWSEFNG